MSICASASASVIVAPDRTKVVFAVLTVAVGVVLVWAGVQTTRYVCADAEHQPELVAGLLVQTEMILELGIPWPP